MAGKPAAHVQAAVKLVLAGTHTATAAAAQKRCSIRALRMALRAAGVDPLPRGRPTVARAP